MIEVKANYRKVNSDERFDHYEVSFQFYDGDALVTETCISRYGVPIGADPADSEVERVRESLQKTLNHIEAKYQQA